MTRIHKPGGLGTAVAVLLFLAVCAYLGAGLLGGLRPGAPAVRVRRVQLTRSAELEGLVLRREQALCADGELLTEDGRRVAAGAPLVRTEEGILTAQAPALFCADLDGLEGLEPELLEDLSVPALRELLETEPQVPGQALGRLVSGWDWYYAALAPAGTAPEEGSVCRLRFPGLEELPARLVSRREAGEEEALVFRLTRGGREALSLRKTGAELILQELSGLELPEEAVFQEDGRDYVNILSAGEAKKTAVEIIDREKGRCIAAASRQAEGLREGVAVLLG